MRVLITKSKINFEAQSKIDGRQIVLWFDPVNISLSNETRNVWEADNHLVDINNTSIEILKKGDSFYLIPLAEIIRLEQTARETNIILLSKKYVSTSLTLQVFDDVLSGFRFVRIHQNHLVNLDHLSSFVNCNAYITLSNSDAIPVAKGNDKKLLDFLDNQPII